MLGRLGLELGDGDADRPGRLAARHRNTHISKQILDNPGTLTDSERRKVQPHPVLGAGLCTRASLDKAALNGILL